jgi:hypothetical protein
MKRGDSTVQFAQLFGDEAIVAMLSQQLRLSRFMELPTKPLTTLATAVGAP